MTLPARARLEVVLLALRQQALLVSGNQVNQAVDGVGCGVLAGVIVAHLELAQEANGEHLKAGDDEPRADDEHGSVVAHQVHLWVNDLHSCQEDRHEDTPHDAQHAKPAKELKRTAHVPEQEADGQEVKKDAEGSTDAIVALAPLAVDVADGNLGDGSSIPTGEGGNEAVHLAVERNVVDDLAAIGFEGGAKVVNVDARQLGHEPVGAARGDAPTGSWPS